MIAQIEIFGEMIKKMIVKMTIIKMVNRYFYLCQSMAVSIS